MGSDLRIRLLGALDVEGVAARDLGSRKARTLLKLLALARGAPVPADRAAEALWGDDPPAKPVDQLGVLVSRLRPVLGADRITRTDAGWSLAADWLDVAELEMRVEEAAARLRAGRPTAALAAARAALALVRGELLADEPDAPWADAERAATTRTVARARVLAAEASLAAGQPAEAATEAERALDHDPYDEAALRVLMRAHTAAGRPASALAAYARARERLAEDLGVDPTRETEDLHTAILLAPDEAAARPPAIVGRARELAVLEGTDTSVVIEGEPGIGKTALLEAWLARVAVPVVIARCDELGRDLPLQPVLDALAPHLVDDDLDVGAVADSAAGRAALFANLLAVLHRLGAHVVAIEDIHLAGTSTLEWLAFARRRGVRVVATSREGGLPGARTLELGPLDLDAATALVGDRAPELLDRSGGNPLFLVELAATGGGELPASVRESVAARVDELGEAASTLRAAAVLGAVDVDLLAGVLGVEVPTLLEHVDAGVHARIIDGSLAFRHDLVREALVAGTNAARRAFVHREAARVLAARPHHDPLEVAFHAQRGGDVDTAAAALLEAASIAADRFDAAEAERLLDRAIELSDSPAARVARARARIARWDVAGARADARAAGPDGLEVAAWAEYYGRDYDLALRYAEEAMVRAGDDAGRAASLAMSGRILHSRGDLHGADDRLTRAAAAAPPDVRGFARVWLAGLRNHQGDPEAATDLVERAMVDDTWLGHPFAPHHSSFFRVMALGLRGRVLDALAACDTGADLAAHGGDAGLRMVPAIDNLRSWLLRGVGRLDEADDISVRVFESTASSPATMEMHCAAALDLLDGRLQRGDLAGAEAAVERARVVEPFAGTMAWHQRQRYLVLQARFALATGDRDRAVELATTAADDAAARGTARYALLARAVQGEPDAVDGLDRVAGLEAWWVTAELAARTGDDGLWRDAERRAGALVAAAGPHADTLRSWVATRFSALGRR
ncbi:MAG TPA: BTAD domain-containing putative transcriptional regulator [Acidimicrobiales bacterium]|nr:BTAD domain-containing putative transcriptional regulator [Acidimicrobiales bacterium]